MEPPGPLARIGLDISTLETIPGETLTTAPGTNVIITGYSYDAQNNDAQYPEGIKLIARDNLGIELFNDMVYPVSFYVYYYTFTCYSNISISFTAQSNPPPGSSQQPVTSNTVTVNFTGNVSGTPEITVTASNPVIGTNVTITAAVPNQSLQGVYIRSSTVSLELMNNNGNGINTYVVTDSTIEPIRYVVSFIKPSNGITYIDTTTLNWYTPVATTLTLTASSSTANIGTDVIITATVLDQNGIPMPSETVTLSNQLSSTPGLGAEMTSIGDGTYTYTVTDQYLETETYTAVVSSISNSVNVSWTFPPGVPSTIFISASSQTAVIGTNVTFIVSVFDIYSTPVPSFAVYIGDDSGSYTMTDLGNGTYSYTTNNTSFSTVGPVTYTASISSLTDSTTVTWSEAGGGGGGNETPVATTLTVSPSSPTAIVGTNVTLTATVLDQNNNPLSGLMITLTNSGSSTPGMDEYMTSIGDGTYTYIVTDPVVETATYYIHLDSLNETTTINWISAPTPSITLVASPNPVYSGRATTLTVTLLDANGNGVVDSNVLLSSDNNIMLLGSSDPVNMSDIGGGVYTFQSTYTLTLTVIQSETFSFTATSSLFQINSTVSVIWKPIPTSIVLSPGNILQPLPTGSGTGITAYVTREDTPISGETVTLSSTQGTVLMNGDGPGTYSSLVTSNSPGTITYTASISAVPLSSNTFNITWANPTNPVNPPCFLEGTKILCQVGGLDTYIPVEKLTTETLVKTCLNGYKKVVLIGTGPIENPGNDERVEQRLYKLSPSNYPELNEDLFITGCHSRLVRELTDKEREETVKHVKRIFVTDKQYRLMACIDEKAEPWNSKGKYTIWHFALEHENVKMNYGVYANGLLVETCSINTLQNKSNFTLIK